jgi:hypothetical protein
MENALPRAVALISVPRTCRVVCRQTYPRPIRILSLQNIYFLIAILNSILISLSLLSKTNSEARPMDLLFLCLIGIFFGMTWFLIRGFESL